ncbi:ATP-dependent DNA helicase PIF1 [Metarhizium rileyi]|uniref:ATP-dependent DNA helicase n=1 Tax=Metarhizium rileyi (strain RCEF 4871) TaxID=1649241 RepID=A0A167CYK0_METRR|nr:ATP-dependent DNA helicase PIF1 [Metarhizium rileyi RCEF 4871]
MASVGYQEVAEQNYEGSAPPLVAADSDTDYSLESLESDVALSSREAWNEARNRKVKLQIANANEQDSSAREGQRFDKTEINLCQEQQDLIDLIASGRNVFFTGSAGCGKSTVLKAAVAKLGHMNRTVHVVAPTGRAALQVNGVSTWSYMGWTPDYDKLSTEELVESAFRKHVRRRLQSTDVLIIDEISMVENHHLERMDVCMKAARQWGQETTLPFGGVQVVVTGDFCQLPPVKPFQHCVVCGNEMEETVEMEDDDFTWAIQGP